jgi:NitT/TauT family transport system substrate-binding protein
MAHGGVSMKLPGACPAAQLRATLGGLTLAALILAACGGTTGSTPAAKPAATAAPAAKPAAPASQAGSAPGSAASPQSIKLVVGSLAFPSLTSPIIAIVKARALGSRHGLDLEIKDYSQVAPYYAALSTGEIEAMAGGPHVAQRMRNDGVPVQIVATYARVDAIQVLTADPAIRELTDLRGKRLAADMSASEYQVLAVYARSKGLDLRGEATVAQAGPPLARQQLKSGEADAAMLWEPNVTLALREDNPSYRAIFEGQKAWQEVTNTDGWELGILMRAPYLQANPEAAQRWIATLREAVQFVQSNLDEADAIVVREVKLPPGIFKEAIQSGRMVYEVQPAWEDKQQRALDAMFKAAVDVGYLDRLPPADVIYKP